MATPTHDQETNEKLNERFAHLPKVVQNAIQSTDVEKQLRALADSRKLHLDQWQLLENNVMLTLLGFQPPEELAQHLKSDLGVPEEVANSLARDVSRIVFEPIRQELERELEHPEAQEKQVSSVESAREHALEEETVAAAPDSQHLAEPPQPIAAPKTEPSTPESPPQQPETLPPASPMEKAVRKPTSGAYKTGEPSTARKNVHDDPYREPPA